MRHNAACWSVLYTCSEYLDFGPKSHESCTFSSEVFQHDVCWLCLECHVVKSRDIISENLLTPTQVIKVISELNTMCILSLTQAK